MPKGKHKPGYWGKYYHRERRRIVKELGGKCAMCGRTNNLEIHHKNPSNMKNRGRGRFTRLTEWKRNIKNLQLLCKSCHTQVERRKELEL